MLDFLQTSLEFILRYFVDYIDIDLTLWISWALMPLMVTFLLPLVILLLLYTSAIILYIYKYKEPLRNAYETDFWDGARKTVAALWDAHGWIWHGYDIQGLENFPEDEPVLVVYYHGALPIDLYYFIARIYLLRNKLIHTVADRFLFNIPGWSIISEAMKVIPGTVQTCSNILQRNNCLAVSPGGVYEAQFSDHNYKLMWNKRAGFAKVAIDAKVRIVPMFTVNVREAFRQVTTFRRFWLWLYTKWRFPFVPIYGGFPVKLRTILGPPISYSAGDGNPEHLANLVAQAINALIQEHQHLPGSILTGLCQRVYMPTKRKVH